MSKIDITPLVIKDLMARTEMGIGKYGRPLQAFNGRKASQDLYEELLDAVQYLKQDMVERRMLNETIFANLKNVLSTPKPDKDCEYVNGFLSGAEYLASKIIKALNNDTYETV